MGNRLSQIATRTGDAGTTGLGDGTRVDLVHERLTNHEPPPGLHGFWQDALERFASVVAP